MMIDRSYSSDTSLGLSKTLSPQLLQERKSHFDICKLRAREGKLSFPLSGSSSTAPPPLHFLLWGLCSLALPRWGCFGNKRQVAWKEHLASCKTGRKRRREGNCSLGDEFADCLQEQGEWDQGPCWLPQGCAFCSCWNTRYRASECGLRNRSSCSRERPTVIGSSGPTPSAARTGAWRWLSLEAALSGEGYTSLGQPVHNQFQVFPRWISGKLKEPGWFWTGGIPDRNDLLAERQEASYRSCFIGKCHDKSCISHLS